MATARELDPLSPIIITDGGYPHYFSRRYGDATAHFEAALSHDANFVQAHVALGRAHLQQGSREQAVKAFERAAVLAEHSPVTIAYLAVGLAQAGANHRARELMQNLRAAAPREYVPPLAFAVVHAALGDIAPALDWLERAVDARSQTTPFLHLLPELDPLRGHHRFQRIVDRTGFVGATQESGRGIDPRKADGGRLAGRR